MTYPMPSPIMSNPNGCGNSCSVSWPTEETKEYKSLMDDSEKATLKQLLEKYKDTLHHDLNTNDYSNVESVQYSKENQINCIITLLAQL
jgi:ribosomal protein S17E